MKISLYYQNKKDVTMMVVNEMEVISKIKDKTMAKKLKITLVNMIWRIWKNENNKGAIFGDTEREQVIAQNYHGNKSLYWADEEWVLKPLMDLGET